MKNANPVSRLVAHLGGLLLLLFLVACGEEKAVPPPEPKPVSHIFTVPVGDQSVQMQLAVRDHEMERGLMQRTDLGPNQGMLFVYASPRQVSFWMRNTPTPLDIGFFSEDGMLREVYPLHPFDERTVPSRSDQIQYALEMHQGWFQRAGIRPGARLDLGAVAAALRERGFPPAEFGGLLDYAEGGAGLK